VGCEPCGEALELGCGYGFLLFPMALFNPKLHWTAVEHPDRSFFSREDFQQALRDYKCELAGVDFVHQRLPFADESFSVVTLSETLEHLPIEGVNFVFDEVTRVLRRGGAAFWWRRLRIRRPSKIAFIC
jgi:SAM-dependent methyltransferase